MDNTILNQDDQQVVENQDNQQVETQQVEQSDNGTPQSETPEFSLDKDGNFQWNTTEYDEKYGKQDSSVENNQQDDDTSDVFIQEEQPKTDTDNNTQNVSTDEEPKFKVKVDGEEIEVTQEELLRGYMRQKDYTQKTQQLAEQRKQYEQYQPQQQFQNQQQVTQEDGQETVPNSNTDLNAMAKEIAAKSLGLESPDDLSELDFNHITAVVEAKQALLNQRNQMMARQQNIVNLEAQLRSEEPKYDEIMKGLNDAIQNLPVSRYNKLQKAYNDGNPEPLRELFKEMQKSYYSKSIQKVEQKRKPNVPVVEHTSNTPVVPSNRRPRIDYNKFGQLSTEEKSKVLLKLGLLD